MVREGHNSKRDSVDKGNCVLVGSVRPLSEDFQSPTRESDMSVEGPTLEQMVNQAYECCEEIRQATIHAFAKERLDGCLNLIKRAAEEGCFSCKIFLQYKTVKRVGASDVANGLVLNALRNRFTVKLAVETSDGEATYEVSW